MNDRCAKIRFLSAWPSARAALSAGHEVRVVPATLVKSLGVGARRLKTDRRDAQILSEVSCRVDLPSVHVPTVQHGTMMGLTTMDVTKYEYAKGDSRIEVEITEPSVLFGMMSGPNTLLETIPTGVDKPTEITEYHRGRFGFTAKGHGAETPDMIRTVAERVRNEMFRR